MKPIAVLVLASWALMLPRGEGLDGSEQTQTVSNSSQLVDAIYEFGLLGQVGFRSTATMVDCLYRPTAQVLPFAFNVCAGPNH
jgi:hypothetical protein